MRHLIDLVVENTEESILYHGTSTNLIGSALSGGIHPPSYWGSRNVAMGFAKQKCRDIGGSPVLIAIPLTRFSKVHLVPDENMIDFCIFDDFESRADQWKTSQQDWVASLEIYHAVMYDEIMYINDNDVSEL